MTTITIPREDHEKYRFIHGLHESPSHTYIDLGISGDFIRSLSLDNWFESFQEHYREQIKKLTGKLNNSVMERREHPHGPSVIIPENDPRIHFIVDYDHRALKFYLRDKDEEARDIVYSYLEKLFPEVRKIE